MPKLRISFIGFLIWVCLSVQQAWSADPPGTLFVTRSLDHEKLLPYLRDARPDIAQIGNYGAMFHGYADHEESTGHPMRLPVRGEREALNYQRELNQKVHDLGLTVVGHFRLVKAMGIWDEKSGFIDYYNNRWPTDLLGPKPHEDLLELVQRTSGGEPVQVSRYGQGQIAFCLSSPHARQMFKQMLKVAVDHGVDGVITAYNYHFECACPYCQDNFKEWLGTQMTSDELRSKLGIDDLKSHVFEAIPAKISGYPEPEVATDLHWLAMRWAAENFKKGFDDIFIDYGRGLNPNLIVAQWNHLSHVSKGEERMFLPADTWGKDEDYFWYSGGAAFVGKNLSLKEGKAGDAWLSCHYVREMSGGRPFVMGKYDGIRMAASMAEGYATGGMGMGRYMRFEDPAGYKTLVQYTQFRNQHDSLYEKTVPLADVGLILPRQSAMAGSPQSFDDFRDLGQALMEEQVLLDVVADHNLTSERLSQYPVIILPSSVKLTDPEKEVINRYQKNGGLLFSNGDAKEYADQVRTSGGTDIEAPWTMRAAAYTQGDRAILHLVNYDRDEGESKEERTSKPYNERPIPAKNVRVKFRLPKKRDVSSVKIYTPKEQGPKDLAFEIVDDRVVFTIPQISVYAVVTFD